MYVLKQFSFQMQYFTTECIGTRYLSSPVHKLLGNFSATFGFFGNFQLVEQLSMLRTTSKFLCLYSLSSAPATSETIKKCRT